MKSMYPSSRAVIDIEEYFKLRKEYWDLMDKFDKLVEKVKELKEKQNESNELIEKLSKELEEKTRLLNQYHIDFGEEVLKNLEKKTSKAKKKTDDGVDIEELFK